MRRLRQARKLTVAQAASAAGVSCHVWQRVEAGESNATLHALARLAATLGVSTTELFERPARKGARG